MACLQVVNWDSPQDGRQNDKKNKMTLQCIQTGNAKFSYIHHTKLASMKISFHGAARTVTGSKHLLTLSNGKKILLDCGLFQGMGKETLELNSQWGFEPTEIEAIVVSHAHTDHIGLLPRLVKQGYAGKIFATPPTIELASYLLPDSARIQESDVRHANKIKAKRGAEPVEPLYTVEDVEQTMPLFEGHEYNKPFQVTEGVTCTFTDCGHILGSAAVNLLIVERDKETRITFSGDVGRYHDMILRSPSPFPQADYLILESTYGNKLHDLVVQSATDMLDAITHTCLKKKGKLIIPAFSVGRTQEILYVLNRLSLEKSLPALDYYVDSPLSTEITRVMKANPECFNKEVQRLLRQDDDVFSFPGLTFTKTVEESKALSARKEPCVIISAAGMAEAGRVKHHIAHSIDNSRNTILIVGYCEPNSLGGKLQRGAKEVHIFGEHHFVEAEVRVIHSMSAHGDYHDISQWLGCQNPDEIGTVFLVHGEYEEQEPFRQRLQHKGFKHVEIPTLHETFKLK
jgi:metallo-beta-lactamase family protein